MNFWLKLCVPVAFMGCAGVYGYEVEHGAHVHGVAVLNMAMEGKEIEIELESPLHNIAGFEHEASSEQDKKTLQQAIEKLKQTDALVLLPSKAGCRVQDVEVALASEHEDHGDQHKGHDDHHHGHGDHHKDNDDHQGHDKGHDDHHHGHGDHHKDNDDHQGHDKDHDDHHHGHGDHHKDHDDHQDHHAHDAEGSEHQDIHAHYHFSCAKPAAIDEINFNFFAEFANMQTIKLNLISDQGVQVKKLTKQDAKIAINE